MPGSLPKEPMVEDMVSPRIPGTSAFTQVSLKRRPQARFEVVIGVGGRVIDHVIAVEFTVLKKSFYGVRHGIRPVLF